MINAYLSDGQWRYSVNTALSVDEDRIIGKCRKPNGGMLVLATQRRRSEVVHFVGDRQEDQAAAINAGLPQENFFWAKDWWIH